MGRKDKLLFELPFTLDSPRLTSDEVGISRLIQRRNGSYEREITVLDTADHRLMRAGVTLEHRMTDGLGEWALAAPGWQPWLPVDQVQPIEDSGDLPEDLAFLIRPLRRQATLGAVAQVVHNRVSYLIEDDNGENLGLLRDQRITIRRGGVTTARFREAVLSPTPAMTADQRTHLIEELVVVGAVPVVAFPAPLKRLGAPSTGLTDFPEPRPIDSKTSLEGCVSSLLARRLQDLVRVDLALRAAELAAEDDDLTTAPLLAEVAELGRLVRALSPVVHPGWRERVQRQLDEVLATPATAPVGSLPESYYAVLDGLILAARAPQLGDHSQRRAQAAIREQVDGGMVVLVTRLDALAADGSDDDWRAAKIAVDELTDRVDVLAGIGGSRVDSFRRPLRRLRKLVEAGAAPIEVPDRLALEAMASPAAFAVGLRLRGELDQRTAARVLALQKWPRLRASLVTGRVHKAIGRASLEAAPAEQSDQLDPGVGSVEPDEVVP